MEELITKINKLTSANMELKSNNRLLKDMLDKREKNYLQMCKIKDDEIKKLKEELFGLKNQQLSIED